MKQIRYGIIGMGNQGTTYCLNIFDKGLARDAVVTAMCDVDPDKLANVKAKTKNADAAYFTDYREMLDSGLCDAVLVETPHYQHPEMVMECLARGIHVISEKPAGVYTKQVREMNEAAQHAEALFGMMFNQRTNCVYRKMRELVADGAIGELQRVTWIITDWYRTQTYYDSGSWRATWSGEGGGVLFNQCPHQLDLLQWIVGKLPCAVHGFCQYGKWHDVEVEDEVTAYLEYDNGATGVFITTTGETPGTNRLEISGTRGKLICEREQLIYVRNAEDSAAHCKTSPNAYKKPDSETIVVETDGQNPQHVGVLNAFAGAILRDEPLVADGREGINGLTISNAMHLSAWTGEAVTLPLDEEKYRDLLFEHVKTSRRKEDIEAVFSSTEGTYNS